LISVICETNKTKQNVSWSMLWEKLPPFQMSVWHVECFFVVQQLLWNLFTVWQNQKHNSISSFSNETSPHIPSTQWVLKLWKHVKFMTVVGIQQLKLM
jgi:hypothetical protein